MIFIFDLILISIIYYFIWALKFLKEHPNLYLEKHIFKYSLGFVTSFFVLFVFFFRFLNLFRQRPPFDLVIIFDKIVGYNFIHILVFLVFCFFCIRFFIFLFKLNFLKVHYYLMNSSNSSYNEKYINFICFFITWPNRLIFFFISKDILIFQIYRNYFYYFLRYFFSVVMLITFIIDLLKNNYCLVYFTLMLPWYSLYQLLYNLNGFLYFDIEYLYDIVITNELYSLDCRNSRRLYHEYSQPPKGYLLENDEYFLIRMYITKKLLV